LTIYGTEVFRLPNDPHGELSVAFLLAAGGLGTAFGPIVARRFTGRDLPRIRWAIAVSFLMGGIYYACMAGAPSLGLVALFLLLARFHGAIIWVFSTVLLQILVRDQFRGRVFAAETSLFTATMMVSNVATTRSLDLHAASVGGATLALGVLSGIVGVIWVVRLLRGQGLPQPEPPSAGPEKPAPEVSS
jgi:MFS family permease